MDEEYLRVHQHYAIECDNAIPGALPETSLPPVPDTVPIVSMSEVQETVSFRMLDW